jgi:hypothetical protein
MITIGMILPTSGIRPMGKSFNSAFKKVMNQTLKDSGFEVEIIVEICPSGSLLKMDEALDKFFGYHDVDAVTGIISNLGVEHMSPKFEARNVPLLINNLGEHSIKLNKFSNNVFINSIHLWQQTWLLGYFAAKQLGNKGSIITSTYDAGYAFIKSFELGMVAASNESTTILKLIPLTTLNDEPILIKESIDQLNIEEDDFVFALFCGEEATLFLNEFTERGYHKSIPLCGLPFLLEPGNKSLSELSVYTTTDSLNQTSLNAQYKNVFNDFGELSAAALGTAIINGKGTIKSTVLKETLSALNPTKIFNASEAPQLLESIGVLKNTFDNQNELTVQKIFEKVVDFRGKSSFDSEENLQRSGWINPYLCI